MADQETKKTPTPDQQPVNEATPAPDELSRRYQEVATFNSGLQTKIKTYESFSNTTDKKVVDQAYYDCVDQQSELNIHQSYVHQALESLNLEVAKVAGQIKTAADESDQDAIVKFSKELTQWSSLQKQYVEASSLIEEIEENLNHLIDQLKPLRSYGELVEKIGDRVRELVNKPDREEALISFISEVLGRQEAKLLMLEAEISQLILGNKAENTTPSPTPPTADATTAGEEAAEPQPAAATEPEAKPAKATPAEPVEAVDQTEQPKDHRKNFLKSLSGIFKKYGQATLKGMLGGARKIFRLKPSETSAEAGQSENDVALDKAIDEMTDGQILNQVFKTTPKAYDEAIELHEKNPRMQAEGEFVLNVDTPLTKILQDQLVLEQVLVVLNKNIQAVKDYLKRNKRLFPDLLPKVTVEAKTEADAQDKAPDTTPTPPAPDDNKDIPDKKANPNKTQTGEKTETIDAAKLEAEFKRRKMELATKLGLTEQDLAEGISPIESPSLVTAIKAIGKPDITERYQKLILKSGDNALIQKLLDSLESQKNNKS